MSGWAVITLNLAEIGGGPAKVGEFTRDYDGCIKSAIYRARLNGMISHASGERYLWELTELGRDFCAGRVKVVGGGNGRPHRFVRTIASVGDGWIERLLLDAGHEPGHAITPAVLRAYSTELVRMVRASA